MNSIDALLVLGGNVPRVLLLCLVSPLVLILCAGCGSDSTSGTGTPTPPTPPPVIADNPVPTMNSFEPNAVVAGFTAQTITIAGTGFLVKSVVNLNSTVLPTTYVSATSLTALIPASAITSDGSAKVTVTNPAPGGGDSAAETLTITVPTPALVSLSPQSVLQGATVTITVTGTGFEAKSIGQWNGSSRPTTYVNATTLKVALTAADTQHYGVGEFTVVNPGGLITTPLELAILANVPTIAAVNPSVVAAYTNSNVPQQVQIIGSGFAANATIQANGATATIGSQDSTNISLSLPATYFAAAGSVSLVVSNPGVPVVQSNAGVITVTGATAPAFAVAPNAVPSGSPDTTITLSGTGFYADSVVQWNSTPLVTTYVGASSVSAVIPAALLSGFVNASISVPTPENAALPAPPQAFTTYLQLTVNDIAYNTADGLIYASIPGVVGLGLGNSVVAIDPASGVILKNIFVGSEPNRIAISTDGSELFVGLDGASAVAELNLASNTAGTPFSIAADPGLYTPTNTIAGLAAVPGRANSVAVLDSSGVLTLYDSGVARVSTGPGSGGSYGDSGASAPIAFGNSAASLYVLEDSLYQLAVQSSGVTASTALSIPSSPYTSLLYDKGQIYTSGGSVLNAISGAQVGQFSAYPTGGTTLAPVSGPIVSDSTLGKAFVLPTGLFNPGQLLAFDETTFNPTGSILLGGLGTTASTPADLIRWGQAGLAFHVGAQLYVINSSVVKDTTGSPADLETTIQVPPTATTGSQLTYQINVANLGANPAQGAVLNITLPGNVIYGSITGTQGACSGNAILYCDLGAIAVGATANVTVVVTPTIAGTIETTAMVSSLSYDPIATNNLASATTTVTGNPYNPVPAVTQLSPALAPAGSTTFTLDVDGTGFSAASTVLWNGAALPTSFVSAGQLSATVDASLVAAYGYGMVSVSNAAPGGGTSSGLPLSIYALLNISANAITFDPFTRKLYAVLPSSSTQPVGNSMVAIDPATGVASAPVQVGSEPNVLAETSDGNYLFIGLSGAQSIGRFNLIDQTLETTIPLLDNQLSPPAQISAFSLATIPGSDTSIAVETASQNGIGILDMSGATGTFRPNFTQSGNGDFPAFTSATSFSATSSTSLFRYNLDANGINATDTTLFNGLSGTTDEATLSGGLLYGAGGGILNPAAASPVEYGLLPFGNDSYGNTLVGNGMIPETQQSRVFATPLNAGGFTTLERFDSGRFILEQQLQLPVSPTGANAVTGVRCGQDSLALLLPGSASDGSSQVLLLRGPYVLPAEASLNTTPVLTTTNHNTLTAGSGNVYVTITGSGFLPGAVVLWNGSPRSTTYTDSAHLSVAVAAADTRTAATILLTSQNPDSAMSNSLTIHVQ